jgi:peptidoglycan/LPS O-acetylase OafA/YrhL
MLVPFLVISSLASLVSAILIWRITSNRKAVIGNIFASLAQLISAKLLVGHEKPDMAIGLVFFAGMVLLGRGLGTLFRREKEPQAKKVAWLMISTGALALAGFGWIYLSLNPR